MENFILENNELNLSALWNHLSSTLLSNLSNWLSVTYFEPLSNFIIAKLKELFDYIVSIIK